MDLSSKTLLLVEDEVIIGMSEAKTLEYEGYNVVHALSGEDAIDLCCHRDRDIDLILMDIDLGRGIDGTQAAQEILKAHDIPVVFLSSHTEKEMVDRTEKITSYGYVVKNSGATVLAASIKMAFKLHEANMLLRNSSDNFSTVFHANPDAMLISRLNDGALVDINAAFTNLIGYSRDEAVGRSAVKDLRLWVNPEERLRIMSEVERKGRIDGVEAPIRTKDDSVKTLQMSASKIIYNNEPCVIIVTRDLTERKRAEEKLNATFRQMYDIIEFLPDPTFVIDSDRTVIYWNKAMEDLTGVRKEAIIGQGDYAYALPFYRERRPILLDLLDSPSAELESRYGSISRIGSNVYAETYISHLNDGGGAYLWLKAAPLFDSAGVRIGAVEVIRDITERKQSEQLLRQSEERFSKAFHSSPAPMVISEIDTGRFLEVNEQWLKLTGYRADELIGRTNKELGITPNYEDRERTVAELRRKGSTREAPMRVKTKSGVLCDVLWSMEIINLGGREVMLSLVYDFTARKKIEDELTATKALLTGCFDQTPIPMALLSMPDQVIRIVNSASRELLGIDDEPSVIGLPLSQLKPTWREYDDTGNPIPFSEIPISLAVRGSRAHNEEYSVVRKDGSRRRIRASAAPIFSATGEQIGAYLVFPDITDLKEVEESLRRSEERYRRLFENTILGIFQTTVSGELVSANPAMASLTGYDSPDELIAHLGKDISKVYADPENRKGLVNMIIGKESLRKFESLFRRKDGSTFPVYLYAWPVFDSENRLAWIEGLVDDITERKAAEERVTATFRQMHDIIEFLPDPTFVIDRDHRVIYWNKAMEDLTGVRKEDIIGQGDYAYALPFYRERRPILIDLVDCSSAEIESKYSYVLRTGNNVYAEIHAAPLNQGAGAYLWGVASQLFDSGGRRIGAIEVIHDITERMKIKDALNESESMYRLLAENTDDVIWVLGADMRFTYVSPSIHKLIGMNPEEARTLTLEEILTPESLQRTRELFNGYLADMDSGSDPHARIEVEEYRKDGSTVWVDNTINILRDTEGRIIGFLGVAKDISERKRMEEELERSLRQKETLMKELQHRVKNNLNLISSLLNIEMEKLPEERSRRVFIDAMSRINSLSALYEKLVQSNDLDNIDLSLYIEDLADMVMKTYATARGNIGLSLNLDKVNLDIKRAVPIGIILNELITNSIKYAFPAGKTGDICVALKTEGDRIELDVSDNGVGLPEDFNQEKTETMGLSLVNLLTRQIDATYTIKSDRGTQVSLEFDL
ncbi:MAG: PAS domain S-box protein [Spirochaetes bacterium]|nr:PAS domain S-box protein [Spirochaetota bacterium]